MGLFTTHQHHFHTETNNIPYEKSVQITENRAPTDESIMLFKELQEKAYNSILSTVEIKSDFVNAVAFFIEDYRMRGSINIRCHVKFKLNNIEYNIDFEMDKTEYIKEYHKHDWLNSKNKMFEFIYNKMSEAICSHLIEKHGLQIIKFIETIY